MLREMVEREGCKGMVEALYEFTNRTYQIKLFIALYGG